MAMQFSSQDRGKQIADARAFLSERGAPLTNENLNRALNYLYGGGGEGEPTLSAEAEPAATGGGGRGGGGGGGGVAPTAVDRISPTVAPGGTLPTPGVRPTALPAGAPADGSGVPWWLLPAAGAAGVAGGVGARRLIRPTPSPTTGTPVPGVRRPRVRPTVTPTGTPAPAAAAAAPRPTPTPRAPPPGATDPLAATAVGTAAVAAESPADEARAARGRRRPRARGPATPAEQAGAAASEQVAEANEGLAEARRVRPTPRPRRGPGPRTAEEAAALRAEVDAATGVVPPDSPAGPRGAPAPDEDLSNVGPPPPGRGAVGTADEVAASDIAEGRAEGRARRRREADEFFSGMETDRSRRVREVEGARDDFLGQVMGQAYGDIENEVAATNVPGGTTMRTFLDGDLQSVFRGGDGVYGDFISATGEGLSVNFNTGDVYQKEANGSLTATGTKLSQSDLRALMTTLQGDIERVAGAADPATLRALQNRLRRSAIP